MTEVTHALTLLKQQISIAEEVLGVLNKCPSVTKLDADGRGAIRKALLLLEEKELQLAKAGEALAKHQRLHLEVEGLREEVRAGDERVQECAKRLTRADASLSGPLKVAKKLLEAGKKAEEAEIEVGDVVDYAQRISGITSAPPYWKPGMAMVGFVPPAPRPEMMRAGALSAFAVATGTTLSTEKLLKLVIDLDKPPDTLPEAEGNERSSDSGDDSTSTSQNRADKEWDGEMGGGSSRNEKEGKGKGKGKAKTTEEEEERDGSGRGRLPTSFSRESPPKRPKISLDISDDSNSEEDDSD